MYQIVRGLADKETMERVLQAAAQVEGGELSLARVTKLCQALEMGKQSQQLVNSAAGSLNRLSTYQQNKQGAKNQPRQDQKQSQGKSGDKSGERNTGCGNCGSQSHSSRLSDRRERCPAFDETCPSCGTIGHFKAHCRGGARSGRSKSGARRKEGPRSAEIKEIKEPVKAQSEEASLNTVSGFWLLMNGVQEQGQLNSMFRNLVQHMGWDGQRWSPARVRPHAHLTVNLSVCGEAYGSLGLRSPARTTFTSVSALVDTGAQMCVANVTVADELGIPRGMLVSPALQISAANNAGLRILGAGFVTITAQGGQSTRQMVYFADGVGRFYLSQDACLDLGIIGRQFPAPAALDDGSSTALQPLTGPRGSRNLGALHSYIGESPLSEDRAVHNVVPTHHVHSGTSTPQQPADAQQACTGPAQHRQWGASQPDHNTSVNNRWGMLVVTISTRWGHNTPASRYLIRGTSYKGGALSLRCQLRHKVCTRFRCQVRRRRQPAPPSEQHKIFKRFR